MTRPMLVAGFALFALGIVLAAPAAAWPAVGGRPAILAWPGVPDAALAPPGAGPLEAAALREVSRVPLQASEAPAREPASPRRGWVRRHPIFFSFLLGATAGAIIGGADPGPENRFAAMSEGALLIGGAVALPVAFVVGIQNERKTEKEGKPTTSR